MAEIRIGTASWTDPGFIEDWYPKKLPASQRLRWYAEHFNLVEVNATFYALPNARVVQRWCAETPDDFIFDVKLPKVLSRHAMQAKFLPPDLRSRVPIRNAVIQLTPESERLVAQRFLREIQPLKDAGKLGAFLLQLSPAFRPKTHQIEELDSLAELFSGYALAVELRNRDWVVNERFEEVREYFQQRKMTFVLVDAPDSEHFTVMPNLDSVTQPRLGYFRLHGRNESGYIRGRSVAERFDYDYSPEEVKEIAERLRRVEKEVERLHIIANNNRSNYAPKLAEALRKQLGLQRELKQKLARTKQGQLF
jgi:uncharacterized protein YecE (DUF72 family)